ncbi:hypothetical protein J2T02_002126 [Chitinophaga terrae (ex Kim and Jung 2007)]|uniref:hypothetical protein n=1 Tax=Chitinophaga terrae (ex Kim and Jung 2007) TaxID=408074 RepID=UPI0027814D2C|nr:hypothetical protein [Chitinophaga terrae (ex Kim and Jung 2007)]MDQ0107013.1 hypothetical protein [Chitinophaga terrae (ex Kim and Jung 2007)]
MKLKFKCLLFLLLPIMAYAVEGKTAYKKIITKNFTVDNNANFNVANKYGKIIFHTWNKNEVKATITITGFGKDDAQAQSNAEAVEIKSENSSSQISLRTTYNRPGSGGSWFSWGNNNNDTKGYVNIDYDIYVPQSLQQVMVDNQFGDVIVERFTFPAILNMNYCTFDIRDAENLNLKINYCDKGKIGRAKEVDLKANYSTVNVERAENIVTAANYSNFTVERAQDVKLNANYSDLKIGKINSLDGKYTYSDVKAEEVQSEINVSLTYGGIKVEKVGTGFKGADLRGVYSDIKLAFSRRQPLAIQANLVYGNLRVSGLDVKNVYSEKKGSVHNYSAIAGGGNDGSPQVKIKGTNTDVNLDVF